MYRVKEKYKMTEMKMENETNVCSDIKFRRINLFRLSCTITRGHLDCTLPEKPKPAATLRTRLPFWAGRAPPVGGGGVCTRNIDVAFLRQRKSRVSGHPSTHDPGSDTPCAGNRIRVGASLWGGDVTIGVVSSEGSVYTSYRISLNEILIIWQYKVR